MASSLGEICEGASVMLEVLTLRRMHARTSAEPDFEVEARLPCFAISSREEQMMLLAVLMLKVEW